MRTVNISEWKQALHDHSQLWCHNCPNPKGQSWTKGSAHNFEWKGAVSGKSILETHHLCGLCLEVSTTWKQPELRTSPAWVLHQSAPKVARRFGSGKQRGDPYLAQTLPTCSCRQAALSSLPLSLAVFSKECWNFMSPCSIHPLFFQVSYAPSFILLS